jgi:class 3 adenylate cyclase
MLSCHLDRSDAMTRDERHRRADKYRSMLAQAATQFGGRVLSVDQDIAILLFANPDEAVRAGLWAREIFADLPDAVGDIQARMSIHVEAAIADSMLESPVTTHSGLAICRAANPGQILVSESAAESLARQLPVGVSLVNLGTHRRASSSPSSPRFISSPMRPGLGAFRRHNHSAAVRTTYLPS